MAADDQEVEAWYLEGWCFYLMAEQAKEQNKMIEDLTWEELARDARECLENCRVVSGSANVIPINNKLNVPSLLLQLHVNQQHSDQKLLEHTSELISQLNAIGIKPLPEGEGEGDDWEDISDEGEDSDVEMK